MNKKIIKRVALGFAVYIGFAVMVLVFYPDNPDSMSWEDREQYNRVHIGKLELGLTHAHIIELLGSPDISEAKKVDDIKVQVMFYRTQREKADGITSQDECTALLFKDNKLVAWGGDAYTKFNDG